MPIVMLSVAKHLFGFRCFEILHSLTRLQNDKKSCMQSAILHLILSLRGKAEAINRVGYPALLIATLVTSLAMTDS
ncbi:MAG: hypothetical protein K2N20_00835 [Helicobacter sp.]|nr:hypothetical protein [Helicobacter sp.]